MHPLPHLRVHKVTLIVVETFLAQVAVDQRLLQEVAPVHLVPRVLDLRGTREDDWLVCLLHTLTAANITIGEGGRMFLDQPKFAVQQ